MCLQPVYIVRAGTCVSYGSYEIPAHTTSSAHSICSLGDLHLGGSCRSSAQGGKSISRTVARGAQIPSPVLSSLERACQNCHSQNTEWPWYSAIPPISWQIHNDVDHGRQFMDLSKWSSYSEAKKRGILISIRAAVQTHAMPPTKYVWMHPEAKLSAAEQRSLENWAKGEQQRIRK